MRTRADASEALADPPPPPPGAQPPPPPGAYRRNVNAAASSDIPTGLVAIDPRDIRPGRRLRAARRRVVPCQRLRPGLAGSPAGSFATTAAVLRLDLQHHARRAREREAERQLVRDARHLQRRQRVVDEERPLGDRLAVLVVGGRGSRQRHVPSTSKVVHEKR